MKRTLALSLVVALSLFGLACAREEHTDITTDTGGETAILSETSSTISTTDTSAPMVDPAGTAATDTALPTTTDEVTTTDTSTTDVTTTQTQNPTP